jgi:hypothetical protein
MEKSYLYEVDSVLKHFKVDPDTGLTSGQAQTQLEKYGPNGKEKG